ncbi:MAG: hypothetical protein ACT4QF_11790 [Sporichthyaceae bacterium]
MRRIPADRIVAEYLAQAAAASSGLLPAHREEFLDRLHDEVRDRVGQGPRRDVAAVTAALAELGEPSLLVARERARLALGLGVVVRDARRRADTDPPRHAPSPEAAEESTPPSRPDGLTAAVVRQRGTAELPPDLRVRPLYRGPEPEPEPAEPGWRDGLRGLRWEAAALAMFVVGPLVAGLLALFLGAAMVARSTFWDVRDKVAALLFLPAVGLLGALVWAWASATQLNEFEASGARLRAAGESLAATGRYAVPVLGLLIAARLGYLVVRAAGELGRGPDAAGWAETGRRAGGSAG